MRSHGVERALRLAVGPSAMMKPFSLHYGACLVRVCADRQVIIGTRLPSARNARAYFWLSIKTAESDGRYILDCVYTRAHAVGVRRKLCRFNFYR